MLTPPIANTFTDHLAAWGTVGAAVGTVATLLFLAVQWAADRRSARKRARHAQAESVSAWAGSDYVPREPDSTKQRIELTNGSSEAVYQVVALLAMLQRGRDMPPEGQVATDEHGLPHVRCLSVLPPGRHYTWVKRAPTVAFRRYGVELAFTDRAGVHWRRTVNGALTELEKRPADYYADYTLPLDWAVPEEVGATYNTGGCGAGE